MANHRYVDFFLAEPKEGKLSEIQLLRPGRWDHPKYGNITITPETFNRIERNFNDNVRKVELAIDPEHKAAEGAYGWVKRLVNKGQQGLYALVDWTNIGKDSVKNKIYKYISAEYSPSYQDPETGKSYKDVLIGAALTNRPFIKGMEPVSLSENVENYIWLLSDEVGEEIKNKSVQEERKMPVTKEQYLAELENLANMAVELEELDDEEKQNLINDFSLIHRGLTGEYELDEEETQEFSEGTIQTVGLSEEDVRNIIREELSPILNQMNTKVEFAESAASNVVSTLKLAEVDRELESYMLDENTGIGKLTPAQIPVAKKFLSNPQLATEFRQFLDASPSYNLSEMGHSFNEADTSDIKHDSVKLAEEATRMSISTGKTFQECIKEIVRS